MNDIKVFGGKSFFGGILSVKFLSKSYVGSFDVIRVEWVIGGMVRNEVIEKSKDFCVWIRVWYIFF